MKLIARSVIIFYQKFISPHKGFRCAYGVYHNDQSCSGAVLDIIETYPVLQWRTQISRQLDKCRQAFGLLSKEAEKKGGKKKNNSRGCLNFDLPCDTINVCNSVPDIDFCSCDFF